MSTVDRAHAGYVRERHGIHHLSRPEVMADPSRYVEAIRELGPLFFDEVGGVWVCSGYAQATAILSDFQRFSSSRAHPVRDLHRRGLAEFAGVSDMLSRQMLFLDPPKHAALRSSLRDQFTPARVREQDGALRAIVASVLGGLPVAGRIDLITDFAQRLPAALVTALLGISGRPERLVRWADAYERLLGSLSTFPRVQDRAVIRVLEEAMAEFQALAHTRLTTPGPDLISSMVANLRERPPETDEQRDDALRDVAANCVVLTAGGYQTLVHLVSGTLLLLDRHPDQQRQLRENPGLVDSTLNEVLRLDGSSQFVARHATVDVDVDGARIEAGQTVVVLLAAANLDPARFTDPRTLRITRDEGRHLGFGFGRHYCVGAPYAERLARWAVLGFLDRYPHYRLDADPAAVTWADTHANTRCRTSARVVVGPEVPPETDVEPEAAHRQVVEWNDTATPLGPARCWHHVVEHHAALRSGAVAVADQGVECTYRDLDERANALARRLRECGIGPERVVCVLMSRSVRFLVAVLAVGKAGGAFLLADPDGPRERLRAMVRDAAVDLVLVDDHTAGEPALPVESLPVAADERACSPPLTGVVPGNTAYVVFTSGTTGNPKAIAINHEAVVNLHVAQRRIFRIDSADRVLQFFSPSFDGCVFDVVMALLSGATLVLCGPRQPVIGPSLTRFIEDSGTTVVTMTPTALAAMPVLPLPRLRVVAAAGERLSSAVARKWTARGRRVLNLYGPAETAVWATWHECGDADGEPPIGRPVPNKRVYVLDERGRPVPVGCWGELHIGGVGVGRYLGPAHLMDTRFRPDPFAGEPGRLLYRTGDICRWRSDGVLEYRGRQDRQVKIRGQRVELDEVERTLSGAPGVLCCAVMPHEGRLAALVVLDAAVDAGPDTEEAIRAHLADRLHTGMIPARFDFVDELPRTHHGKTDPRREPRSSAGPVSALPAQPDTSPDDRFVRETRLTWQVARFFATCFELEQCQVRSDSDFFALGGDSLVLAELLTFVEEEHGVLLAVDLVLDQPTPHGIATHILDNAAEAG